LAHPFIKIPRRKNALGGLPIKPSIIGYIAEVTKLHGRPGLFNPLREIADCLSIAEDRGNPLIFKAIGKLPEHRKDIARPI
jgi:hypothetical protein